MQQILHMNSFLIAKLPVISNNSILFYLYVQFCWSIIEIPYYKESYQKTGLYSILKAKIINIQYIFHDTYLYM